MKLFSTCLASLILITLPTTAVAQAKVPYWASIGAGKARMRTGPGQQFPVTWMYQRAGLPIKVIATYPSWRKVEDPDGTIGWMQANLISEKRTGIVRGAIQPLRNQPNPSAKVIWRVEAGVIGTVTDCADGWCKFDVKGRTGFIETAHIWGAN